MLPFRGPPPPRGFPGAMPPIAGMGAPPPMMPPPPPHMVMGGMYAPHGAMMPRPMHFPPRPPPMAMQQPPPPGVAPATMMQPPPPGVTPAATMTGPPGVTPAAAAATPGPPGVTPTSVPAGAATATPSTTATASTDTATAAAASDALDSVPPTAAPSSEDAATSSTNGTASTTTTTHVGPTTVFVGQLPPDLHDSYIRQLLETCGTVVAWKRARDPVSDRTLGFGFATFATTRDVLRARRLLDNLAVDKQPMRVRSDTKLEPQLDAVAAAMTTQAAELEHSRDEKLRRELQQIAASCVVVKRAPPLLLLPPVAKAAVVAHEPKAVPQAAASGDGVGDDAASATPHQQRTDESNVAGQDVPSSNNGADNAAASVATVSAAPAAPTAPVPAPAADVAVMADASSEQTDGDATVNTTAVATGSEAVAQGQADAVEQQLEQILQAQTQQTQRRDHDRDEQRRRTERDGSNRRAGRDNADAADRHPSDGSRRPREHDSYERERRDRTRRSSRDGRDRRDRKRRDRSRSQSYERSSRRRHRSRSHSHSRSRRHRSDRHRSRDRESERRKRRHDRHRDSSSSSSSSSSDGSASDDNTRHAAKRSRHDDATVRPTRIDPSDRAVDTTSSSAVAAAAALNPAPTNVAAAGAVAAETPAAPLVMPKIVLGLKPVGSAKRDKVATVIPPAAAFVVEDEVVAKPQRAIVPLDYTEEERLAGATLQQRVAATVARINSREIDVKSLIAAIPTDTDALFAFPIDWAAATAHDVVRTKLAPWVATTVAEYLGAPEPTMAAFVIAQLTQQTPPRALLSELAPVLDDDAEVFVKLLWRKLAFEAARCRASMSEGA